METDSFKTVVFSDDDFTFLYSEYEGNLFIHCRVNSWKPSVLKKMYDVFGSFVNTVNRDFYTVTPNPKFAQLFGGEILYKIEQNGTTYEVIKWELKPQSS